MLVVDRNDGHPEILVRIGDGERGDDRGDARVNVFPGLRPAAQRGVVHAEVGIVRLHLRRGVEGQFGYCREIEVLEASASP